MIPGASATSGTGGSVLGANTYTGLTTVGADVTLQLEKLTEISPGSQAIAGNLLIQTGGAVLISSKEQIADTSLVTVEGGATLELSGLNDGEGETIGELQGGGNIMSNLFDSYLAVGSGSFSGILSDSIPHGTVLSLNKVGSGTLTLSGANTYSGTTTVEGGTLRVNGTLGNTAVTVESDAILGGTGSIQGSVTVADGGVRSCRT